MAEAGDNRARMRMECLDQLQPMLWQGQVIEANGQWIEAEGPPADIGDCCEVRTLRGAYPGEVVGFRGHRTLVMLFDPAPALRHGDAIVGLGEPPRIGIGPALLGRVVDAQGRAIDRRGPLLCPRRVPVNTPAPRPFERLPIQVPYETGVRAIDGMLALGRGQRAGIFGGSGVGKSTLIGMLARSAAGRETGDKTGDKAGDKAGEQAGDKAGEQISVVALVGERGREVLEFVENSLGQQGLSHAVVVVATSDQSPLLKVRAAETATAIAEYFQGEGKDVLLIIDSLTRFAMAAREIGLANGEPPTSKGYTPSVFSRLAKLVERAGRFRRGSITALYTVLMEGDDQQDPVVDAVRSYVDGHILLSRALALDGWYPPIDVVGSVSRLMSAIVDDRHARSAADIRRMLAAYAQAEDLLRIGAYKAGSDPELDRAIQLRPRLRRFFEQRPEEFSGLRETLYAIEQLVAGPHG